MPENEESNQALRRLHAPAVARVVDALGRRRRVAAPHGRREHCDLFARQRHGADAVSIAQAPAVVTAGAATARGRDEARGAARAHRQRRAARPAVRGAGGAPMPSLICEVLHPAAHWSGSPEGGPWSDALGAAGAGDDEPTRLPPSPRPDKASDDPSYATPAVAEGGGRHRGRLARGERRVRSRSTAAGAVAVRARRHALLPPGAPEPALALGGAPPPAPDLL